MNNIPREDINYWDATEVYKVAHTLEYALKCLHESTRDFDDCRSIRVCREKVSSIMLTLEYLNDRADLSWMNDE